MPRGIKKNPKKKVIPDVITTEHLASKIRSANDSAENPPN
jgi:hypothetical protein